LLEGLEISEILKKDLERTLRIDSEFYSKENLRIIDIISKHPLNNITQLVKVSDGNHMAISDNYADSGVPYYRGQNMHHYFIEESSPIFIDTKTFNLPVMKRSHLKEGDVLLSIVGTIGGVALVSSDKYATCSCKLAIFRPENTDGYFLSAFLKSKYGQNQIKKFTRGAVQMGLILEDMNQIMVPILSSNFQKQIRKLVQTAKEKSNTTRLTYTQAETILLGEIGLNDFDLSKDAVNIKSFKESFGVTGRLDAEYYQPKYELITSYIKSYKNGYSTLEDFIENYSTGFPYKSESYSVIEGIPLIRINNISKGNLDLSNAINIPFNDFELSKKDIALENDILISMSGTIGNSCKIRKGIKAVVNQRIMRITPKNINFDVLPLMINSLVGQLQLERIGTGGVQTNISATDIKLILIPNLEGKKQEQIAELVEESFKLKVESERLLEVAKKAVEMAIEINEKQAMKYINENS